MSKVALWKIFEERSSWEILKCNHEYVIIYNLVFSRFIFRYDPLFETPYKQGVWKRRLSVKIRTHMWQFLCKQKNVKKYVFISKPKKKELLAKTSSTEILYISSPVAVHRLISIFQSHKNIHRNWQTDTVKL